MKKDIQEEKAAIRKLVKERSSGIPDMEMVLKSEEIFNQLEDLKVFQEAENVMIYWSLGDEVHTHGFIVKWYQQKNILLPVINGKNLDAKKFTSKNELVKEPPYFILEPIGEPFDPAMIDLIVVPGVAFDTENNRLGRGKAFYDRFLIGTEAYKVGVCFDFQF